MGSRVNRPIVLATVLVASFSVAGCRGCRRAIVESGPVPGTAAQPAATPGAAAEAAPPAKPVPLVFPPVVAKVNGEEIYRADLERAVRGIETQLKQRVPGDKRDGVIRGVLDRLINYRLLLQEARRRGIEVPPADIDAQLEGLARQFKTPEQLREMLVM